MAAKASTLVALVWVVTGCGLLDAGPFDIPSLTGIYSLDTVDGGPLPATVAATGCSETINSGSLELLPGTADAEPLYSWSLNATGCPTAPGVTDFGSWGGSPKLLRFQSSKGFGTYDVHPGGGGTLPAILTLTRTGHQYAFHLVRRHDAQLASLDVSVLDEAGGWVNGAALSIVTGDGLVAGGTTNNNRALGVAGVAGVWKVSVTPPSGYTVPASTSNPTSVQVSFGVPNALAITLHKIP